MMFRALTAALALTLVASTAPAPAPGKVVALGDLSHASGIVASLAHPGAAVTGLSAFATDTQSKLLDLPRERLPDVARVAFLFNMGNPVLQAQWREAEQAARSMGLQRADAVIVGVDAPTLANREQIVRALTQRRLPAMSREREFVDAGGLISYGIHYPDSCRRAAVYVNLRTAKLLRRTIPPFAIA